LIRLFLLPSESFPFTFYFLFFIFYFLFFTFYFSQIPYFITHFPFLIHLSYSFSDMSSYLYIDPFRTYGPFDFSSSIANIFPSWSYCCG
jgi:hypothetical protein